MYRAKAAKEQRTSQGDSLLLLYMRVALRHGHTMITTPILSNITTRHIKSDHIGR